MLHIDSAELNSLITVIRDLNSQESAIDVEIRFPFPWINLHLVSHITLLWRVVILTFYQLMEWRPTDIASREATWINSIAHYQKHLFLCFCFVFQSIHWYLPIP